MTSKVVFLKDCLEYFGPLEIPYEFQNGFLYFCKIHLGILIKITVHLQIALNSIDIFIVFFLKKFLLLFIVFFDPSINMGIFLFICVILNFCHQYLVALGIQSFLPHWFNLFLNILFYFYYCRWVCFHYFSFRLQEYRKSVEK